MRQRKVLIKNGQSVVRSYAVTHPVGEVRLPTQPGWDQIIYAKAGLVVVRSEQRVWTVPPHRAMCLSSGTRVQLHTRKKTTIRCVYLRSHLGAVAASRVVNIDALTRELLLDAVRRSPINLQSPVDDALITLLIARLSGHPTVPLQLPMPADTRARALAETLLAEPALSIDSAVGTIGASRRTLERLFATETRMTLAAWQRRARILASVALMAQGSSVTNAAMAIGYSTPSSFVTAFRSEFGRTPREFMGPGKP